MDIKEATELVNRSMEVILSCRTLDQLGVAVSYSDLAYKKLDREIGLINNTRFISLIERAIGFAQCQVHHEIKPLPFT